MKLILTAAIDNLGVPGDIVEVKAGYGRNYLLPRGYAVPATRGAEKQVQDLKRAQEARAIRDADRAREVKEQLANLEGVSVAVRTANNGKLFGSVKPNDVAQAVVAAGGPELDKHSIDMTKGFVKSTGKYSVDVKLHEDIHGTINFEVVSQEFMVLHFLFLPGTRHPRSTTACKPQPRVLPYKADNPVLVRA